MKYADGQLVLLGDQVTLGGESGIVVFSIDTNQYSAEYPEDCNGGYLKKGVMFKFEAYGLIHYEDADEEEDLVLVARA